MAEHEKEFLESVQTTMMSFFKKMRSIMEKKLEPYDITFPQLHILRMLEKAGATSVSEIAEHMKVKPSSITVMIDRLVKQALVFRYHDPEDRRVVLMELTPKGEDLFKTFAQTHHDMIAQYFSHFTKEELTTFTQLFQKLVIAMDISQERTK